VASAGSTHEGCGIDQFPPVPAVPFLAIRTPPDMRTGTRRVADT
jgi:hypothetical protein